MKCIHKALNHKSSVISGVAKLSIHNPWLNYGSNYCHIRYEYNMDGDMYASDISRVWQAAVTDKRISIYNISGVSIQ